MSRISDYDSQPFYHGSDGLRTDSRNYLLQMLNSPLHTFTVRYAVGTADGQTSSEGPEPDYSKYIETFGEEPPWAAAARSRRANPYLKKEQEYMEFEETIVPRVVAEAIMSVRTQIAAEMRLDLSLLPGESSRTLASYKTREKAVGQWQGEGENMFAAVGSGEWEPSPFRFLNFDLMRKMSVRYALLDTLDELSTSPKGGQAQDHLCTAAVAQWFKAYVGRNLAVFEGPAGLGVGDELLLDLLAQPFIISAGDEGGDLKQGLIDPMMVCERVMARRDKIAAEWAAWLDGDHVEEMHADILNAFYKGQQDRLLESTSLTRPSHEDEPMDGPVQLKPEVQVEAPADSKSIVEANSPVESKPVPVAEATEKAGAKLVEAKKKKSTAKPMRATRPVASKGAKKKNRGSRS